jgi:hypothetical protein
MTRLWITEPTECPECGASFPTLMERDGPKVVSCTGDPEHTFEITYVGIVQRTDSQGQPVDLDSYALGELVES